MIPVSIQHRIFCALIGYVAGNFMTAQFVTKHVAGKKASEVGDTGNPGMANVMSTLGFKAGITVLIGDLIKTFLAMALCHYLFGAENDLGYFARYYAALGATLGHDFPLLFSLLPKMEYRGGKGVATTCGGIVGVFPIWGIVSCLVGAVVVLTTKLLSVGGVVIPAVFTVACFVLYGNEAGYIGVVLTILMFIRHFPALKLLPSGNAPKDDVGGAIKKKLSKE